MLLQNIVRKIEHAEIGALGCALDQAFSDPALKLRPAFIFPIGGPGFFVDVTDERFYETRQERTLSKYDLLARINLPVPVWEFSVQLFLQLIQPEAPLL